MPQASIFDAPAITPDRADLARALGAAAFATGKMRVPALDPGLKPLLTGTRIGDGVCIKILEAWLSGWDTANLAAPLPELTDTDIAELEAEYDPPPSVADTILEQLGGRRFLAMTGASVLNKSENLIDLLLPSRFAKDGINHVRITLDPDDTYSVRFSTTRRSGGLTVIHDAHDVYCDQLQEIFTDRTGLFTHL